MRLLKTRRQRRYKYLSDRGFTDREATEFSRISFRTTPHLSPPFIRDIVRSRIPLFTAARKRGITGKQYNLLILKLYRKHGWTDINTRPDPWRLFHFFENKYQKAHKDYESPWESRRRKFVNWKRAYETGKTERERIMAKYREDERLAGRGR